MFCAQIVGKPWIAPEPAARPAVAAAPFSTVRRFRRLAARVVATAPVVARSLVFFAMSASPVIPRAARPTCGRNASCPVDANLADQPGAPQVGGSPGLEPSARGPSELRRRARL